MLKGKEQISRRQFLKQSLIGSAALLGLPHISLGQGSSSTGKPPNFVIILCDDLGYSDLSCYGSTTINTPVIDHMAAEGIRFTDFYSAAPVCTPSRAALMTGCYPVRVGLPTVLHPTHKIGINSSEITMAEMLKTRGYKSACIGKWHLGHHKPFLPTRHGFDYYYGIPYSNDMMKEKPVPLLRNEEIIEQPAVQETLTERYTQEAINFISDNKDQQFFLYLPHTFPHVPLHVSERFKDKSRGGLYGDVVECIDWSTGEILNTLKKQGLDQNTMVIFTSDNGPWLSQGKNGGCALPLRDGKSTCWEGGMREPCIIRWPGRIQAGSTCRDMATMMDFYPTIANMAGADIPKDRIIDGEDIRHLILDEKKAQKPHKPLFYYRVNQLRAVRSGRWKLALELDDKKTPNPQALYDLQNDIAETTDLSASYPKVVERLLALVEQCRDDLGDSLTGRIGKNCRLPGKV